MAKTCGTSGSNVAVSISGTKYKKAHWEGGEIKSSENMMPKIPSNLGQAMTHSLSSRKADKSGVVLQYMVIVGVDCFYLTVNQTREQIARYLTLFNTNPIPIRAR